MVNHGDHSFGKGCSRCGSTIRRIEREAAELSILVSTHRVTDGIEIAQNGIMTTPAVKIEDKIVHSGGIPSIIAGGVAARFAGFIRGALFLAIAVVFIYGLGIFLWPII